MWLTSIAMCYLDCFIDNLNYTFQDFLIIFFELLARITLVIGAISIFPQEPGSPERYHRFGSVGMGRYYRP